MPAGKNILSRIDPYPFLVLAVSLFGVLPLLVPGFFVTDDGLNHLNRIISFDAALRAGDLYPRWIPEFALGYGYPVLNYYSPVSYYVAEFFHLIGFGFLTAEKLTFAFSLVVSGLAAYLWMKEAFASRWAGFVVAVAYMYFPYRLTDIYTRGALAESMALVFLPLLLWSTFKIVIKGDKTHVIFAAAFLALLVLSHNVTALFFVPIWLGYAALLLLFSQDGALKNPKATGINAIAVLASLLLGLGLSAFYWLPALREQSFVSTDNFKSLGLDPAKQISAYADLIQTQWVVDYIQWPPRVGLIQVLAFILGIGGFAFLLFMGKRLKDSARSYVIHAIFFVVITLGCLSMMSPAGIVVWSSVPLVEFIQFPWRLLAFLGLGTAVLAGLLAQSKRSFFVIGLPVCALLVYAAVAGLNLNRIPVNENDLDLAQAGRYEADSGAIGGTVFAEYMPVWAKGGFRFPDDKAIVRPASNDLAPSGLAVTVLAAGRNYYQLAAKADKGGPLPLHQFFFPGWQARIDGKETKTYPSTALGLVTVDVPPGEHKVEIFFGDSEVRSLARGVSLLGLLVLVGGYLFTLRRQRNVLRLSVPVLSVALFGFFLSASLSGAPQTANGEQLTAHSFRSERVDLGPLRVAGFELDSTRVSSEGKVRIVLYWQSPGTVEDCYVNVTIKDEKGKVVGSRLTRPILGTARTYLWNTDELVRDEIYVPIEASIEPGRYTLEASVVAGTNTSGVTRLGTVELPRVNISPSNPSIQPASVSFGQKVSLAGYKSRLVDGKDLADERSVLRPGEAIELSLYWKTLQDMDTDYTVFVHLIDARGKTWAQVDSQPGSGFSPTSQWLRGETAEDRYMLRLPQGLPVGVYGLEVGFYDLKTMARLTVDGGTESSTIVKRVKVLPLDQSKESPAKPLNAVLGGAMALEGATINGGGDGQTMVIRPGEEGTLKLRLFWRADKTMDKNYTIFIHVLDASGKVVAQTDGQPMGGAYQTAYWSPGEKIGDDHDILLRGLAPGDYQIKAGAYLLETLTRLETGTGEDSVVVGNIRIGGGS